MKISVIIPAYNEERTIAQTVGAARDATLPSKTEREIIVVNDGSTDGTAAVLKRFNADPRIRVLTLDVNCGKTAALLAGIRAAAGEYMIFQDADREYDPVEYSRLLAPVLAGKASVVFGSRFLGTIQNMDPLIRFANRFNTWAVNFLYRSALTDVNTGFKVLPRDLFRKIRITSSKFGGDAEITSKLLKTRQPIMEVPIDYTARSRKEGKKMDWLNALHMFFCFFFTGSSMSETDLIAALRAVSGARRYREWILGKVRTQLDRLVLDIGSGLGDFMGPFAGDPDHQLILSDASAIMVEKLRCRFEGAANIEVVRLDISEKDPQKALCGPELPDTVTCLNVLEHIEDDGLALRSMRGLAKKNGYLVLLVPALGCLYGSFDRLAGHYRRYSRGGLRLALEEAGWRILSLEYINFLGAFSWFLGGLVLRQKKLVPALCMSLDRFVPLVSFFERLIKPPFGQSLFAVAENPG